MHIYSHIPLHLLLPCYEMFFLFRVYVWANILYRFVKQLTNKVKKHVHDYTYTVKIRDVHMLVFLVLLLTYSIGQ